MKGDVYSCYECKKVFATTFIADGISCPYCGGWIGPIGETIDRKQYNEMVKKMKSRDGCNGN